MKAEDMFKKLGFEKSEYKSKTHENFNALLYIKEDEKSELDRVGMRKKKVIEFYDNTKEVLFTENITHRDNSITKSGALVLSVNELLAVEKQIKELGWQK